MIHRGIATFTLDTGRCPRWLFERMVKLGREMVRVVVAEEGPEEFIRRIADPVWFQSLGTVLAFDWNSSGLTTILTAALKEAIQGEEKNLGIFICGGKGKTSRKTPEEIVEWSGKVSLTADQTNALVYNSRMAAKVDSALVQDGFQIYHHSFFFTKSGSWTVVQQGMNTLSATARRYHWHSDRPRAIADDTQTCAEKEIPRGSASSPRRSALNLVCEPHTGIVSHGKVQHSLNLTAEESTKNRAISTELVSQSLNSLMKDIQILRKHAIPTSKMMRLTRGNEQLTLLQLEGNEADFVWHPVLEENFSRSRYLEKILWKLCDQKPESYEKLLATEGVGPKTVRALALVAEVIYGAKPSYEDPARYSFAHGGKDAVPYPVDRATYDKTISLLARAVERSHLSESEKKKALIRLYGNDTVVLR